MSRNTENSGGGIRKRIVNQDEEQVLAEVPAWLPVDELAEVEVSSEDPDHPIEHALLPRFGRGWRAGAPGRQVIRLLFDRPQTIHQVYLHFEEGETERRQEFVLRGSETRDSRPQEIVRQQWNFSPSDSTHEIEDYRLAPRQVAVLELEIVPETSGGDARASLQQFYIA